MIFLKHLHFQQQIRTIFHQYLSATDKVRMIFRLYLEIYGNKAADFSAVSGAFWEITDENPSALIAGGELFVAGAQLFAAGMQ